MLKGIKPFLNGNKFPTIIINKNTGEIHMRFFPKREIIPIGYNRIKYRTADEMSGIMKYTSAAFMLTIIIAKKSQILGNFEGDII
ncbi:hypothetical protein ACFLRQ_00630 [Bacteroidota bacterium]